WCRDWRCRRPRTLPSIWTSHLGVPLVRLAALEADLRLRVGLLRAGRLDWRNGEAVLALHGGRLLADPLAIDGAGGRIALRVAAEGAASPPSLDVSAHAPSVDLAALLPALGLPGGVSGMLDAETALSARGRTLREMAAGLNGSLGLALADGRVDISLLDAVAGDLRRLLLPNAPRNGSEAVRCLALRLQARDGVASAQAMLLETDIASVLGSGSVDLGQERLDLRLLPRARLGGIGLAIPVVVDGALAQPRLRADPQGAASAGAAILKELSNRRNDPGGTLGQTLNQALGQILGEGDSEADCAAQLRIARGGREGPVPAPAAPENRQGGVGDLLRGLLRR
ncbi:AsmA-like C-terminal region-containing protein, partial [Roseomonas mucosa]|uniref:AsmA family protein n=1 Tax=Roseomonas mucosa TaxID=207340 RepID=UPI001EF53A08